MATIEEYKRLKKKADKLKQEADEAAGAFNQIMQDLRKEYKVNSLEDAKKLLKKMEKEEARLQKEFDEAMADFEEKWNEKLGE